MAVGKSETLASFERAGAATLSADAVVHDVLADPSIVTLLVERFGEVVAPGGVVDRPALATAAFASEDGHRWLEQTIWPRVGARTWAWIGECRAAVPPPRAIVVEVPLLFESGMDAAFDHSVCVVVAEAQRSEWAGARGHAAQDRRESRQMSQDEKAARADFVIDNNGTLADLRQRVEELLTGLGA